MIWCPKLTDAILVFSISVEDEKFLSEHEEAFKKMSKFKNLSIGFIFVYNKGVKTSYWGLPWENQKSWKLGSRKTDTIANFLQATTELSTFNASTGWQEIRAGDNSYLFQDCIQRLSSSHNSLKHLAVLDTSVDEESSSVGFSAFKDLRTLGLDLASLALICARNLLLPSTLAITYFTSYHGALASVVPSEENLLVQILIVRALPQLKLVGVPQEPNLRSYKIIDDSASLATLKTDRERLEGLEMFRSARVGLKLLRLTETDKSVI